jgi:predicted nucleotidyltransferase
VPDVIPHLQENDGRSDRELSARASHVIRVLEAHRAQLETMGVRHSWVFGSVARGDDRLESDVDILIEVDTRIVKSLFDYGEIQQSLEEWLQCSVGLADKARLRPNLENDLKRDQLLAF